MDICPVFALRANNQHWTFSYYWTCKNEHIATKYVIIHDTYIRVITKLLNTEQSSKGKGKTHKSINRQNQSTTEKLGKPQWP